jgi:altronate hydrolase
MDKLVKLGGSAILSEFPELRGVEQELVDRCIDKAKAKKFITLMESYESKVIEAGTDFSTNPSPGNIKDGLITDAMKSAGAAKKGGSSPIVDVLDYGEYFKSQGLNLLCTPGNDVESTTAMAGSGANLIIFTTGLGTPTGNPITPVIKVSSNTAVYKKMKDIIDFNTGSIIEGSQSLEDLSEDMLEFIIKVASGESITKASQNRQFDFLPWKRDISL